MYANETYQPADEKELAALIVQAGEQEFPLEVCGSRTKKAIGRPMQTAARVSTRAMRGVTLYEPTELVLSAKAGTALDEIEALLDENGQELAFEPARWERIFPLSPGAAAGRQPSATIGGVFATNSSGPRRILRGSARDHLIGIRAVNGLGEIIKSGGRVMKNVTGYDLGRTLAGSWGTLAALTEVTMKVMPKAPTTSSLVILNLPDEAAVHAMCEAMKLPYEVSATVHLPAEFVTRLTNPDIAQLGVPITVLRIENFPEAVSRRIGELREKLKPCGEIYQLDDDRSRSFWKDIRNMKFLGQGEAPVWRISTAPDRAPGLLSTLRNHIDCLAGYEWSGGLIWMEMPPSTDAGATIIRRVIAEFEADAMLIRAGQSARASVDVFPPLPEAHLALVRGMKDAFDPRRVLNPGRIYAGI